MYAIDWHPRHDQAAMIVNDTVELISTEDGKRTSLCPFQATTTASLSWSGGGKLLAVAQHSLPGRDFTAELPTSDALVIDVATRETIPLRLEGWIRAIVWSIVETSRISDSLPAEIVKP
ncbi:MAG: hypothetical protein AAF517_25130 [Planctomycetota bacterium]